MTYNCSKQVALEVALTLNSDGNIRNFLIRAILEAFGTEKGSNMGLQTFTQKLRFLTISAPSSVKLEVQQYLTCLRLEILYKESEKIKMLK